MVEEAEVVAQNSKQSAEQSSESTTSSNAEIAYKAGYEVCMLSYSLEDYTKDNESLLKELFVRDCQNGFSHMKPEYRDNRSLYKEYRRGLLKAYEDQENAKNAL